MKELKEIRICDLKPFEGHPYKVRDDKEMDELIDSIREHGIMTPLIVRRAGNGYEIISGHKRAHAAELAGLDTVPAIEMDMTKDEAAVALVDSNLHREHLLPSEKAFAYKLKLEALSRQGRRTDLTSGQVVPKSDWNRTTAVIGAQTGESYKTVQRYPDGKEGAELHLLLEGARRQSEWAEMAGRSVQMEGRHYKLHSQTSRILRRSC